MLDPDEMIEYYKEFDSQLADGFYTVFGDKSHDIAFLKARSFYSDSDINASVLAGAKMGLSPSVCVAFMTLLHALIFERERNLSNFYKKNVREKYRMHKDLSEFYNPTLRKFDGQPHFQAFMELNLEERRRQ